MKLLEVNIRKNLDDLEWDNAFLDTTLNQNSQELIGKLDFIKVRNLYSVKDNIKVIRPSTRWGEIFAKDLSDKGCCAKYTKKLFKLYNNKWPNLKLCFNRHLTKEEIQMENHMKRCSTLYVIREMKI